MNLQRILKFSVTALLYLVPIFPLIVANSLFFPFITGKAFYFRIVVELAFAGWMILAFLDAKYRPKFNWLTVSIIVFGLVTLLADLLGVSVLRSIWSNFERMEGWMMIIHLVGFFIVASNMFGHGEEGKRNWHNYISFSVLISLIVAIYGVLQLLGLVDIHQGSARIDASLGNAAYMAVYMLIHAFLSAYMFFVARAGKSALKVNSEWVYGILSLLYAFLVIQTATRGTTLGLIGGVMLALFLFAVLGKKESKKWRLISIGIIVFIVAIGGIFWSNRDSKFVQNSPILSRFASISIDDTKTQARGYVWPMAIKAFTERPLLGWGQENFNYVFNANYNPKMWVHEQWFDRAHNVFLDWLVASGALGILSYLSLYVLFLIAVWKSNLNLAEKSTLTGLIVSYAIHNIFVFDNLSSYALFFIIIGFGASISKTKPIEFFGNKSARVDVVEYIVAPIVIVLLVACLYFLNIRAIQANSRLIKALGYCTSQNVQPDVQLFANALELNMTVANQEIIEQLLQCSARISNGQYPNPIKQSFSKLTSEKIQQQISLYPKDARMYVLGGSYLNIIGQPDQAVKLLEEANKLSPRKQSIMIQLAMAYANFGKTEESVEILKEAHSYDSNHNSVNELYARMLIVSDNEAEARKIFNNDPKIFETEQIANVYIFQKKYAKALAIYEKLIAGSPDDVNLQFRKAQIQFTAGMKWEATQTIKEMIKKYPEYKAQLEAAIKEIEK